MGLKTRLTATAAAMLLAVPLVNEVEGVKYYMYYDVAGVPTVCAGITGTDVIKGKVYTQKECDILLAKHMKIAQDAVDKALKVDVPHSFRAAMYSFTFNVGGGAYRQSTMLKLTNQGKLGEACEQLWRWVYITKNGEKVRSKGLHNRRSEEHKYCVRDL